MYYLFSIAYLYYKLLLLLSDEINVSLRANLEWHL